MPIHDQGYRRYRGGRTRSGRAWAVILTTGVRMLARRRAFLALLLVAWFPFFARAVQIYAAANLPQASFLAPTPQMFREFLGGQSIFVFLVAVYAGAGLIANDRRANALSLYLAKPLTRVEYVFGKLAVLMTFLLVVTGVPALLLLVVQSLLAGDVTFVRQNIQLVPAVVLFSLLQATTVGTVMLALSSLSNSSRYVGILYAGLVFFTEAVHNVLARVGGDSRWAWISLQNDLARVADAIFSVRSADPLPAPVAFGALVAAMAAAAVILERRVRGVEVVT
jgi:ABC-2 type transport system permease protein